MTPRRAGAPRAPLRLRRGRPADAARIAAAMRAAIAGLGRSAGTAPERAAWGSLPPLYHGWAMTAGGERYVVAERGARLAGYGAWRDGELTALFVRPAAARAGVASRLLARIEREARAAGVRALVTLASRSGAPFYRARGFEGGPAVRVPLPGGLALRALRLTKRLGGRR